MGIGNGAQSQIHNYSILNIFYFIYFIIIILNYFIYSNIMSILFFLTNKLFVPVSIPPLLTLTDILKVSFIASLKVISST